MVEEIQAKGVNSPPPQPHFSQKNRGREFFSGSGAPRPTFGKGFHGPSPKKDKDGIQSKLLFPQVLQAHFHYILCNTNFTADIFRFFLYFHRCPSQKARASTPLRIAPLPAAVRLTLCPLVLRLPLPPLLHPLLNVVHVIHPLPPIGALGAKGES